MGAALCCSSIYCPYSPSPQGHKALGQGGSIGQQNQMMRQCFGAAGLMKPHASLSTDARTQFLSGYGFFFSFSKRFKATKSTKGEVGGLQQHKGDEEPGLLLLMLWWSRHCNYYVEGSAVSLVNKSSKGINCARSLHHKSLQVKMIREVTALQRGKILTYQENRVMYTWKHCSD